VAKTNIVFAVLDNGNTTGEGNVGRLDAQRPVAQVQVVALHKVDIFNAGNLEKNIIGQIFYTIQLNEYVKCKVTHIF
jgi:hypothetical protein